MRPHTAIPLILALMLVSSGVARATVMEPEIALLPLSPAPALVEGEAWEADFALAWRTGEAPGPARLGALSAALGAELLPMGPAPAGALPAGYQGQAYRLRAVHRQELASIALEFDHGGRTERQEVELGGRASVAVDGPRPQREAEPGPAGVAGAAPRPVTVDGRITMTVYDETDERPAIVQGVHGATVKLMRHVDVLDDETLGQGTTGVDGSFSFVGLVDGTIDVYVKVEAANESGVNVGTGLFFQTYNRIFTYDDLAGDTISLGDVIWADDFNEALFATHTIHYAHQLFQAAGVDLPRVDVRYPDNSSNVSFYATSAGLEGIHLNSKSRRDAGTLFHEYGHHFVSQEAESVSPPFYCNNLCDRDGKCGHCLWCDENEATAWSEGLPDFLGWLLDFSHTLDRSWDLPGDYDFEELEVCQEDGQLDTPRRTEGFLAALLQDMVDIPADNDLLIDPASSDQMTLSPAFIIDVAMQRGPSTSYGFVREAYLEMVERPEFSDADIADYWETVRNNGLAEDDVPPTAPTSVSSPSHPVGVSTPNSLPSLVFTGSADDFTGVYEHVVSMSTSPTIGGLATERLGRTGGVWPRALAPGEWYAHVRAMDGGGNLSTATTVYGPMVVGEPEPLDLRPVVDGLWEAELIVRNSPDASPAAVGWPPTLVPGLAWFNLQFRNDSPGSANSNGFSVSFEVAGVEVAREEIPPGAIGAGQLYSLVNVGPVELPGGRHLVTAQVDVGYDVHELEEGNNVAVADIVVRPPTIAAGTRENQPAPLGKSQDGAAISGTTPGNQGGVRFTPGEAFSIISTGPIEYTDRVESEVYAASTGPLDGFRDGLASPKTSAWYHRVSYVVLQRDLLPSPSVDIGASFRGTGEIDGGYWARAQDAQVFSLPATGTLEVPFSLDWGEDAVLLQLDVDASALGFVEAQVEATFSEANGRKYLACFWIPTDRAAVGLNDFLEDDWERTREDAPAIVRAELGQARSYALAVVRSGFYPVGENSVSGTIRLTRSPRPELRIPEQDPVWPLPMIPNLSYSQDDTLAFPAELVEGAGIYMSFSLVNDSPFEAPVAPVVLDLGGQAYISEDLGPVPAMGRVEYRAPYPIYVPGGRRPLILRVDPGQLVDESDETNNVFALQFGVRGPELPDRQPLQRFHLPDPQADLASVRSLVVDAGDLDGEDGPTFPLTHQVENSDGVRLVPSNLFGSGRFYAVAAMPGDDDIELRLFDGELPATEAFVYPLASSNWGWGESEFVMAYAPGGSPPAFDVGIYDRGSDEPYHLQALRSQDHGSAVGGKQLGPFPMPVDHLIELHEFLLEPGSYQVQLTADQPAGVALGFSLHPAYGTGEMPYHSKSDVYLGAPWGYDDANGGVQLADVDIPRGAGGRWCIAVWKHYAADRTLGTNYQLDIVAQPLGSQAIAVDGFLDPAYGDAVVVQEVETSAGDNVDPSLDRADGSELDGVHARFDGDTLFLLFTGNLASDGSGLEVFLDTGPGGQPRLLGGTSGYVGDALVRMGDDGSGNGLRFEGGFDADWYFGVEGNFTGLDSSELPYLLSVHMAELLGGSTNQATFLGASYATSAGYLDGPPDRTKNPFGIRATIHNGNTAGVSAGTGADDGSGVWTGVELAIPLAALGGHDDCIDLVAFLTAPGHGEVTNQVLGPVEVGTGALGDPRELDFAAVAGWQNFQVCPGSAVGVGDVPPDGGPAVAWLHAPSPNPFNPRTSLAFTLRRAAEVTLVVHDSAGRVVRQLLSGEPFAAGQHSLEWDGEDQRGRVVASGVYHAILVVEGEQQVRRMVLLK